MIEQVNITNFRCFKHLEVEDLKRINLLVGENSSGKSAFLESIFISSGSLAPNVVFQMRGLRKMGNQIVVPVDAPSYRGIWEDLFFNFQQEKKISIKASGNPSSDSRSLSIQYVADAGPQELPFGKQSSASGDNSQQQVGGMPQIEFTWKRANFPETKAKPRVSPTGWQFDVSRVDLFPCVWFSPGATETPDENAKRFSELDKTGEASTVLEVLKKEFPFILDLSIDYHAGIPMMFAKVQGKPKKMPVPLVSDGINRLLGIAVALGNFRGGTILIDQLEDGFHHRLLPSIWKSLYLLAKEFNVQLFVSTHSAECIAAMKPILNGNEEDFRLLRATREEVGCTVDSLPGKYLDSALEQNFEVR